MPPPPPRNLPSFQNPSEVLSHFICRKLTPHTVTINSFYFFFISATRDDTAVFVKICPFLLCNVCFIPAILI